MRTSLTPDPEDHRSKVADRIRSLHVRLNQVLGYLAPDSRTEVPIAVAEEFLVDPKQASYDLWLLLHRGSHTGSTTFGNDRGLRKIIKRELHRVSRSHGYQVALPLGTKKIPAGNVALLIYAELLLSSGVIYDL